MALDNKSHLMFEVKEGTVTFYDLRVDKKQIEEVIKAAAIKFGEKKEITTKKTIHTENNDTYARRKKGTLAEDGVLLEDENITTVDTISVVSKGSSRGDTCKGLATLGLNYTVVSYPPFTKELLEYLKDTSNVYHLDAAIEEMKKDGNKKVQGLALAIKDAIHKEPLMECNYDNYYQYLYELSLNANPDIASQALDLLKRCAPPSAEIMVEYDCLGRKKVKVADYLEGHRNR